MLDKSRDIVGDVDVGGGRDEDSIVVGGRNTDTAGVYGVTLCVPNDWMYDQLDTDFQEGRHLHLLKRPHCHLTDKGLSMPFLLTALEEPAASRS